jgi:tetratricopeptide (TPR) repeat protein
MPPCLTKLREWHRAREPERVIEALKNRVSSLTEMEKAVYALALASMGKMDARPLLESVAGIDPNESADVFWLSDIGLACLLTGQTQKSVRLFEMAISLPDATGVEYGRLAAACLTLNDLNRAEQYYREAVNREPGRPEWHHNLGGVFVRQQRLGEALDQYDLALNLNPKFSEAVSARQRVLVSLDRTEELVADLQRQVMENPDDYPLRLNLARALDLDNRPGEAFRLLREALLPVTQIVVPEEQVSDRQNSGRESYQEYTAQLAYRSLMADLFSSRSLHRRALSVLQEMEHLMPEVSVSVSCRQAHALAELLQYENALEKLDTLEMHYPDENQVQITRAAVLCEKGDYTQAETILRHLIDIYPGDASLLSQLGQTLMWVGKLDEAVVCFEKASKINPMALAQMVNARKMPDDPAAIETMKMLADNPVIGTLARQEMSFALAILFDRKKEYDPAFHYLAQANRLVDKGLNYNPDHFKHKTDQIIEVFDRDFWAGLPPVRPSDRTPVFVVGMPRSGTTLTEQILGSHPDIFPAGELPVIPRLIQMLPKVLKIHQPFPMCIRHMNLHIREEAARHYLYSLYEYDETAGLVVDKMPHNFVNLGLIAMIFPLAKIIHVNRDPRDTAVSNFQQNFKARHSGLGYAFNLKKIARQINDYHRLMEHWRQVLPIPIFDLSYEQMVSDMPDTAKKLLNFVGVDWHPDVNRFYENQRAVRTASVAQVRQPIYKTAVKKWKHYQPYLGDLLSHLDSTLTDLWDAPDQGNSPYESRIIFQGKQIPFGGQIDQCHRN